MSIGNNVGMSSDDMIQEDDKMANIPLIIAALSFASRLQLRITFQKPCVIEAPGASIRMYVVCTPYLR
jgi:hypothetical protein